MYVRHGVSKCNATQCFSDLVMGQGRLPIMGAPQDNHCRALGVALQDAIVRDFGSDKTKIQGVPMTADSHASAAGLVYREFYIKKIIFRHKEMLERLTDSDMEWLTACPIIVKKKTPQKRRL